MTPSQWAPDRPRSAAAADPDRLPARRIVQLRAAERCVRLRAVFLHDRDHKLLKDGTQAKGVVTSVHERKSSSHNVLFDITGHLRLPGGAQVDFEAEKLDSHKLGWFKVGQIVPVRYDRADTTKAALDIPALEAKHSADRTEAKDQLANQHDAAAVARADAKLARGGAPGLEDDWPEDGIT